MISFEYTWENYKLGEGLCQYPNMLGTIFQHFRDFRNKEMHKPRHKKALQLFHTIDICPFSALCAEVGVFVAGAEIVYGSDSASMGSENRSPRDVAAESVAGSILDMGSGMMDRASAIQPTITIRPGRRMGIFVQQDVVFPYPYF